MNKDYSPFIGKNSSFIVKNIDPIKRKIKVFGSPIPYNQTRDLLLIPGIGPSDIQDSLINGELQYKLNNKEIEIIFCDVDLLQFNSDQTSFMMENGCNNCWTMTLADKQKLDDIDQASKSYLNNISWYLSPATGSDTNSGIDQSHPLKTFLEFQNRIISQFGRAPNSITLHLMDNCFEDIGFSTDWMGGWPGNVSFLTFDGSLGQIVSGPFTIGSVIVANPATPTEWRINIPGMNWVPFIGQQIVIKGGTNDGVGCWVLANLGSGSAVITQPAKRGTYFDSTLMNISPGDTISIYKYPQLGNTLYIQGVGSSGQPSFQYLTLGGTGGTLHQVTFKGLQTFLDSCSVYNIDTWNAGLAQALNCFVTHNIRTYDASQQYWTNSGGTCTINSEGPGSYIYVTYFTNYSSGLAGLVIGTNFSGGVVQYNGWLAISNQPNNAIRIACGGKLIPTGSSDMLFGTNCIGNRIVIYSGGTLMYPPGFLPNLVGSSGTDLVFGPNNITKSFSQLPYLDVGIGSGNSLAMAITGFP